MGIGFTSHANLTVYELGLGLSLAILFVLFVTSLNAIVFTLKASFYNEKDHFEPFEKLGQYEKKT